MKMVYKKNNVVELITVFEDRKTALIYDPYTASKQNGNGYITTALKNLIPEEYYNKNSANFMSKSEKNKIKERLTLIYAEWICTDGNIYTDCEKAIEHEKGIMGKEEK